MPDITFYLKFTSRKLTNNIIKIHFSRIFTTVAFEIADYQGVEEN